MLLVILYYLLFFFFFFNDTATTEIYTLSLHDALPIFVPHVAHRARRHDLGDGVHGAGGAQRRAPARVVARQRGVRSEEHTSELQSLAYLVCRLLLEKKKNRKRSSLRTELAHTTSSSVR